MPIAKALQTGMHPHPVYIPTGEISQHCRDYRLADGTDLDA